MKLKREINFDIATCNLPRHLLCESLDGKLDLGLISAILNDWFNNFNP